MPNFFSYYFLLWSIPTLQLYIFILVKTNTMPKKSWGQKNSITILYIMLIRYGIVGRQNTIYIYILLYSSSLSSSLILYYTHETRTRIYYYYIALFFFAFFFSYYSIFFFIILYSYILIYPTKFKPKQIIYCYFFYLIIYVL